MAGACILLTCAGLACQAPAPEGESRANPDLQGGPLAEGDARAIALAAAEGLRAPSPELKHAFVAKVMRMLAHRDAAARATAAEDLGDLARKAAAGPLQKALADPDRAVRAAAAKALGAAGDAGATAALLDCLKDPAPAVRAAAAGALGAIASREKALRGGQMPGGVGAPPREAGTPPGEVGAPPRGVGREAGAALVLLLNDTEAAVRKEAAVSLGILKDANAVPRLGQAATTDADISVRSSAVTALGRIGAPEATTFLTKALEDESPLVRHAAVGALGAICGRAAAAPADGNTSAAPADVRAVVPALIARLKDRHAAVRAAAAFTLGRIADPASAAALADAARTDPDESVRAAAEEALQKLRAAVGETGQPEKTRYNR